MANRLSENRTRTTGSLLAFQGCRGHSGINGDSSHGPLAIRVPTWRMSRSTQASNSHSGPLWAISCESLRRALVGARQAGGTAPGTSAHSLLSNLRERTGERGGAFLTGLTVSELSPLRESRSRR